MAIHYRTDGFFLKKKDRGEADQLFTIYTKDFGKLEIFGKAIRKIKSKLRAGAEIFYLSQIEFIQGKTHKTLTDAILIEKFPETRKNLEKLRISYKIAEVADELIKGEEKDEKIWQLITGTFKKLNSVPQLQQSLLLYYYFFWSLLALLGYQSELYNCSLCQRKIKPQTLYFSSEEGGIICQDCFKKEKKAIGIDLDTVKILRLIFKKDLSILNKLKIKPRHLKSLQNVSEDYFQSVLR